MEVQQHQYDKRMALLTALGIGEHLVISEIAPANPALLVEVVKIAIDMGEPYEFNKDYTKVRRLDNRIYSPVNQE